MIRLLATVAVALAAAAPALASERRPTLSELEGELICPTCKTTLDQSNSPVAERMRAFIRERIAAGATKSEIKDALVGDFGTEVLAAPPKHGFSLLAWLLPLLGLGAGAVALSVLAWRWSRSRDPAPARPMSSRLNGRRQLEPELERRLEQELARFD